MLEIRAQPLQDLHLDKATTQRYLRWRRLSTKLRRYKSEALSAKRPPNQAILLWSGAKATLELASKWGKLWVSISKLGLYLVGSRQEVQIVPIGGRKFSSSTRILNFQASSKCSTGFWPSYLSRQGRMLRFSIARSSVKMTRKCTETQWKEKGGWQEIHQSVFTAQLLIHLSKSLSLAMSGHRALLKGG